MKEFLKDAFTFVAEVAVLLCTLVGGYFAIYMVMGG
jgi:hypothetical protein